MKRLIGIIALTILITLVGQSAMAQTFKFGHINSDELIQTLPSYDSANANLEKYRNELIDALELMTVELNNKSDAYNRESKNLSDIVKQNKEQELVDMNRRIQTFQNDAQVKLQDKNTELLQPIYEKVDKALKEIGKENGFIYIFDVARGSLVYFDETKSTNVMVLAKAKLGIK